MFRFHEEGETVKYGFNVWRLSNPDSFGFVLKFWHNRLLWFRYSKLRKMWFIYFVNATKENW